MVHFSITNVVPGAYTVWIHIILLPVELEGLLSFTIYRLQLLLPSPCASIYTSSDTRIASC